MMRVRPDRHHVRLDSGGARALQRSKQDVVRDLARVDDGHMSGVFGAGCVLDRRFAEHAHRRVCSYLDVPNGRVVANIGKRGLGVVGRCAGKGEQTSCGVEFPAVVFEEAGVPDWDRNAHGVARIHENKDTPRCAFACCLLQAALFLDQSYL